MAAAPTPHAGSRATSLCVRIGVAALLLLFYVDAFLRTGAWFSWVLFGVLLVPAAIGLIVTTRDLPGALDDYTALTGHGLELRSVASGPPQIREVPRD
jgi:hypothetical protein